MTRKKFDFPDSFQELIQACMVKHNDEFAPYGLIVKPEYFNGEMPVETGYLLSAYVTKHGFYPTYPTLRKSIQAKFQRNTPEKEAELQEYVTRLEDIDTRDVEFVIESLVHFARERALYNAIRVTIAAQQEGKPVDAVKLVEEALAVGQSIDNMGFDLKVSAEEAIDRLCKKDYGVATGFTLFDRYWPNGWAPGWLIVPLAPAKRYKTLLSLQLALNMTCEPIGADVIYFACEISQDLAARRTMQAMTGMPANELYDNPDGFKVAVRKELDQQMTGHLWFKDFPSGTATMMDMRVCAKSIIRRYNLNPKAIFIDYAETTLPSTNVKDAPDWRKQADIYTGGRALGYELKSCVVMPDRMNAEGMDLAVPNRKSFQGSIQKGGIIDVGIGLCQTEEEYVANIIRYFVFLNRHGPEGGYFQGKVEPEIMRLSVDTKLTYAPEKAIKKRMTTHSRPKPAWNEIDGLLTR